MTGPACLYVSTALGTWYPEHPEMFAAIAKSTTHATGGSIRNTSRGCDPGWPWQMRRLSAEESRSRRSMMHAPNSTPSRRGPSSILESQCCSKRSGACVPIRTHLRSPSRCRRRRPRRRLYRSLACRPELIQPPLRWWTRYVSRPSLSAGNMQPSTARRKIAGRHGL